MKLCMYFLQYRNIQMCGGNGAPSGKWREISDKISPCRSFAQDKIWSVSVPRLADIIITKPEGKKLWMDFANPVNLF